MIRVTWCDWGWTPGLFYGAAETRRSSQGGGQQICRVKMSHDAIGRVSTLNGFGIHYTSVTLVDFWEIEVILLAPQVVDGTCKKMPWIDSDNSQPNDDNIKEK